MRGLPLRKQSTWDRVTGHIPDVPSRGLVRSGLAAGATVVAVSVASAATSALRRRLESS